MKKLIVVTYSSHVVLVAAHCPLGHAARPTQANVKHQVIRMCT